MLREDGNLDIRIRGDRGDQYQIQRKLGRGTFGVVYEAIDLVTKRHVAAKIERPDVGFKDLENEMDVYEDLHGCPGIPEVYWYGDDGEGYVLVFELLGPNLEDFLNYCGRSLSLKTVLMLADQLIPRMRQIHNKYIHRDIKPENLLMGAGKKGNCVFITDFGMARDYEYPQHQRPDNEPGHDRFAGSTRFASIRAHLGKSISPRDDLESLGYVLVYLLHGSLPWQPLEAGNDENMNKLVGIKKQETSIPELCAGLPKQFELYFEHIASIAPHRKPNYAYLRRLFKTLFSHQQYHYDSVFDWTELKFFAHLKETGAMK